jgi:hypothetical protein
VCALGIGQEKSRDYNCSKKLTITIRFLKNQCNSNQLKTPTETNGMTLQQSNYELELQAVITAQNQVTQRNKVVKCRRGHYDLHYASSFPLRLHKTHKNTVELTPTLSNFSYRNTERNKFAFHITASRNYT